VGAASVAADQPVRRSAGANRSPGEPDVDLPVTVALAGRSSLRATSGQEATIPTDASWAYAQTYVPEDDVLGSARQRADEVGCTPVDPGTGAALQLLAALVGAKAVVEVGTGTGVSGLWLLRGMRPEGVLTTVERETEHSRLARETFVAAGIAPQRTRLITGRALEVLPRLADASYDLAFFDGAKDEYPAGLVEAHRLLRGGGVVAFDDALWHDKVADPAQRDPATVAMRSLVSDLRDDERWLPLLLPVGTGLLIAQKRA